MANADIADFNGERLITVELAWNEIELIKLIPGARYRTKDKIWTLPLAWASMVALRGIFLDKFTYTDELALWTWEVRNKRVDVALTLRDKLDAAPGYVPEDDRLYPFQRAGVDFMAVAHNGLLGDELGVGKTPQALLYLSRFGLLPAIIICPNSVKYHWQRRAKEWFPMATPYVVEGGTPKGRKIIEEATFDPTALVIVNYESVRAFSRLAPYSSIKLKRCKECDPRFGDDIKPQQCHVHVKELNGFGFRAAVIDEAHRIGDPQTLQTRAVWAVVHDPSVEHRWALTGTPDNVKRLWSIMHAVSPDEYPTRSKWMDRYALQSWNAFGGLDVVGIRPDTRDELYKILDPRYRRMIKEIVLPQLPPIIREVRYSSLSPSQTKMYKELDKQLHTRLDDGQLFIAKNKLVSKTRLMQFAAGTVHVDKDNPDDPSTWKVSITDPSGKIDELDAVLDELGDHPFVVACEYRDVVQMAAERLGRRGIRHDLIVGGMHPEAQVQVTDDLKSGKIRAIVFTIKAGGIGMDMSGADTMIMLQRSWSFIENVQCEGRAHRIGSEVHESIRIIDIVTQDTIEERQVEKLHEKLEQFEEIARDRQQVQERLSITPYSDNEFSHLVTMLDELNQRRDQLMSQDTIESFSAEDS